MSEWERLKSKRPFFECSFEEFDEIIAKEIDELDEIAKVPVCETEEEQECRTQALSISRWCIYNARLEKEIQSEMSAHEAMKQEVIRKEGPPKIDF